MPIVRRSDCVLLPMVFCPVIVVASNFLVTVHTSNYPALQHHKTITGKETVGSKTQSDLLTMDVRTPETF
jgi:hypothetical protein